MIINIVSSFRNKESKMPPKRGRPPAIESQKIIDAILAESKNIIISKSGNIADKNQLIWKRISQKLKNLINPHRYMRM